MTGAASDTTRIDKLDETPEEQAYFNECIRLGRVYFGPMLAAFQGVPVRHHVLAQVVKSVAEGASRPVTMLEIGSWAGGSAVTIGTTLRAHAASGSRLYCLDPWRLYGADPTSAAISPQMRNALRSGSAFQLFLHNIKASRLDDLIVVVKGAATDVLPVLAAGSFDLVFVDGDHTYAAVKSDVALAIPLVRDGGILCGDDLEKQFFEVDAATCLAADAVDFIPDPASGTRYHPGVTRAVHELIGPVSSRAGFWAMRKEGGSCARWICPISRPPKFRRICAAEMHMKADYKQSPRRGAGGFAP